MKRGKRALLIGVDRYSQQFGNKGLKGCVRDVRDLADTLMMSGYDSHMIDIITNERATGSNVKRQLKSMVENSSPGDYIIFYFAGYGSRITKRPRHPKTGSRTFKSREILCPYDMFYPDYTDTIEIS